MSTRRPPKTIPVAPLPSDRATAPMAIEEDSASAWQRFEELQRVQEAGFQTTQPATRPNPAGPSAAYAPTQPAGLSASPAAAAPEPASVNLEQLMLIARRNNRACPVPAQWSALHQLLVQRQAQVPGGPPPVPVDGPAWGATSAMQKRLRLRDQLEWADRAGLLREVGAFLTALPEHHWHHFGD